MTEIKQPDSNGRRTPLRQAQGARCPSPSAGSRPRPRSTSPGHRQLLLEAGEARVQDRAMAPRALCCGNSAEAPQGCCAGHHVTQNPPSGAQLPEGETETLTDVRTPGSRQHRSERPPHPPTDERVNKRCDITHYKYSICYMLRKVL